MVDVTPIKTDLTKIETEFGFVRANWGKLSIIIIVTFVLGAIVGHLI